MTVAFIVTVASLGNFIILYITPTFEFPALFVSRVFLDSPSCRCALAFFSLYTTIDKQ
jgi:hypothetical protein